eukprot:3988377-Amphidinium_carterae.1
MSTMTNGTYMLSLPKQQPHKRDPPAVFGGNNKADTTSRPSATFQNWATTTNVTDTLTNVKVQQLQIHDDAFIEEELDKRNFSI